MSKNEEQVVECPNCSGELDYDKVMKALETKGSFKCTHCGSLIEAEAEDEASEEVEENLEDSNDESTEEMDESDDESSDESEVETDETEEDSMSTSQEVAKVATKPTATIATKQELPTGHKTADGVVEKATKSNGSSNGIDHEAIITNIRKKLLEDKTVGERVHDTYVSFYKNEKGTARGKRFMVVYRNGRNIKAQFFGIEKVENPNVRVLETEADAFEYKGKDTTDFQKYLDQVF